MNADDSSNREVVSLIALEQDSGKRLDAFLAANLSQFSRAKIKKGIDEGGAIVDGHQRKASYKLTVGEAITFQLPPAAETGPAPEEIPLSILYEDDAIAVIDKPAGMVVHPAKGHWSGTLASALVHHFGKLSERGGETRPGIVHRLDRDTSGAIVVAKTDDAHRKLSDQFKDRTIRKEYLALIVGAPDRDRDIIDFPIGDHPHSRERKALRADHTSSRPAQTFYEVEERFRAFSLIRAFPKTGRTHQIRLHLLHIGCAILCDKLYGGRSQITIGELRKTLQSKRLANELAEDEILLHRQALHAHQLGFQHPTTGEEMLFTAPLPQDLDRLIMILRQI